MSSPLSVYARWLLAAQGDPVALRALAEALDSSNVDVRRVAAYALRHLTRTLPLDLFDKLAQAASQSQQTDRVPLLSAAWLIAPSAQHAASFKTPFVAFAQGGTKAEKCELCAALAGGGDASDLPLLAELLGDAEPDVRVSAAGAVLRIERRKPPAFSWLDWIVLIVYAVGIMLIGWSYSRVKNVEEYLLGGRTMKPWAVGISLFATLMSTLTYLSYPGEMISHGPMILSGVLGYPLVYLVVGRLVIPSIMRLRITSAYEILERRFGLGVRMLGSTFFLVLRLFWMALIVYATSDAVLVPLLHLDHSATPWVCVVLALITIAYTSMGGLQAVVFIDVLQTFIMLAGAVLSLVLISRSVGGVSAWWPREWSADWDAPSFFFATDSRVSMGMAVLSSFIWYLCTASSDQIAVQRYLATRDAASARKMFGISLICDVCVAMVLCALGLALFAYFRGHPEMLPDNETIASSADKLLSQYIVRVLPSGLAGLVVAGILSAAMDSLSSGLNSAASVIVADWIPRFWQGQISDLAEVRQAKVASWFIGLVVILLSLSTIYVPGNLMEVSCKIANLLVAPLAVLFFMAMFVPWATTPGTWAAAVASVSAASCISFQIANNLSFLWIMPVSLVAGLIVGGLVSWLPFGQRRPMLEAAEPMHS